MATNDEEQQIGELVNCLSRKYPQLTAEAIATAVREAHERFVGRPVRDFVPLLCERR
ncbi:three-helix bundle dimerization domain-containing protein [Nocardia sp. NPDC049707]|uniref:three-helix bundle dimerization domain-containing protein n=1 Tax=Nocardia sp. NPDC049707 TaxID=3154735 RepID=UPI0034218508